ncbi:MAG: ABC transporter transmembrane domain-containing protein [Alphaproteobacteria bacterium]
MDRSAAAGGAATDAAAQPVAKSEIRHLRQIWPFLAPHRAVMVGAFLALTVAAGTVLAMGMGLRHLVDEGFASGDPALLDQTLIALLVAIFLLAAATYGRFYLVSWLGERAVADMRRAAFDHILGLDAAFFETTRTGELMSRLTTDTTLLQVVIGSSASVALRNLLLLIGGTVMLFVTSLKLSALVFLVVPVVIVPIIVFGRRVRRLSNESQERIADLGALGEESINAIQTVQAYTHEAIDRRRFDERAEQAFTTAIRRVSARALLTALVMILVFGAVGVILWIGGHDVLGGAITAGELSAFVFYAVVVAGAVGALSEVVGDLQRAAGAIERLLTLLRTESRLVPPSHPTALPEPPLGEVRFDDVTFHYPSRPDRPALEKFSLVAAPGERVALVGPSGAGKSTVFQLLLRFHDPAAGAIALDGIELRDADPKAVRARFGIVAQNPVIFGADAWENIRYGRPDASDEDVRAAATAAAATEFLDRLPQGFSTFLGTRGVRLSGGQAQRIAIARAILRNPSVLLLDEATSALDAESEHAVQVALEVLMEGRTTLVIAHRLATVLKADRIVVMDEGRIVATGKHADLVAQGGLYARLAKLQFEADPAVAAAAAAGRAAVSAESA